ncbi:gliding motility lipoprotein GldD [Muriicola sp.]|uniref:gliding motility lipoprotein GldD n=1 Tax=Muriicola sp. TaxID=2020856 RepID=UPI00356AF7C6
MRFNFLLFLCGFLCLLSSCGDEALPKPKAQLRLEYPAGGSDVVNTPAYSFESNNLAQVRDEKASSLTLDYPALKGAIYLTYKPVEDNLVQLLSDAQKLSYEHVIKADNIMEQKYIDEEGRVYGMFYEVKGDAASQAQFYATDSTRHFLTGSLYFYAKPNYDSVYPAAVYLQKDVRRILETLKWK